MLQAEEIVFYHYLVPQDLLCCWSESGATSYESAWNLTVLEMLWFGVVRPADQRELDFLEALALEACPLLQTLFGLRERLALSGVSR